MADFASDIVLGGQFTTGRRKNHGLFGDFAECGGRPPVDLPTSESGLLETDSLAMIFADLMRFCALDASNVFPSCA